MSWNFPPPSSDPTEDAPHVEIHLESVADTVQAMIRTVDFGSAGSGFALVEILLADGLLRSVRADAGWVAENELQPGDIAWVRPVELYSSS